MDRGLIDRLLWRLAWRLPETLVYYCAVRVVTYASVTKYRNTVMGDIPADGALGWWYDQKLAATDPEPAPAG